MTAGTVVVGLVGHLLALAILWVIYRDASGNDVGRPRFWAGFCAGAFALGIWLILVTDAPLTGAVLTANTGLVLYGFEREVATEDDSGRHADGISRDE